MPTDTTALLVILDELKAKREKATPGKWHAEEFVNTFEIFDHHCSRIWNGEANRKYIDACSPANMLALDLAVRELIAENERLKAGIR